MTPDATRTAREQLTRVLGRHHRSLQVTQRTCNDCALTDADALIRRLTPHPDTSPAALDAAIEDFLGTPRPQAGPQATSDDIRAYELAHQRLRAAYRASRGEVEMCPVSSSISGQPCLLPAGHPQDSATRFHCYAPRADTSPSDAAPELRDYIDQLEPVTPVGYPDDSRESFAAGFGWALDAILDYLDGQPWTGGVPPRTHGADGKPLPRPLRAEDPPAPVAPAGLDAAWAEAEAALPEGWRISGLRSNAGGWSCRVAGPAMANRAAAFQRSPAAAHWSWLVYGPTPAGALLEMADRLRAAGRTPVEPAE